MKIEKKSRTLRREQKQRKSRLVKRVKTKANLKHYDQVETDNSFKVKTEETLVPNNNQNNDSSNNILSRFLNKLKSSKSFATKTAVTASLLVTIVVVSANINPILNYTFYDQNSALYPVLKKYADSLRGISNRLMVVTRRLNMLSILSEENELTNTSRVNSLVLQINEMWFTTKKYLNYIGIETVAHTDLEKEIDANSKVNEKGLIRETNSEKIFPEDQITLTNVLKLDSIIQDLNIQIDNVNNEINFLEDNVYASIKASHVYSHLLERSRYSNGNYYATSSANSTNDNFTLNTMPTVAPKKKILLSKKIVIKPAVIAPVKLVPIKKQLIISKKINSKPIIKNKVPVLQPQSKKIVVAKIKPAIDKIVGAFTIKEKPVKKPRKDQTNKLIKNKVVEPNKEIVTKKEDTFGNPSFLDNVITDFAIYYDEYEDDDEINEEKTSLNTAEEDDYSGG